MRNACALRGSSCSICACSARLALHLSGALEAKATVALWRLIAAATHEFMGSAPLVAEHLRDQR
jgi:hypothetical protein